MKSIVLNITVRLLVVLIILTALVMIALSFQSAAAQDMPITVCRDDTYPTLRFEFHNIPTSWFTYGSDVSWGYWAGGVEMQPGLLIADALEVDTDGYAAGTATVNDYDNGLTWQGDAQTAACGVSTPIALETPKNTYQMANNAIPVAVVSSGRTCVIKYPQIVLVCS